MIRRTLLGGGPVLYSLGVSLSFMALAIGAMSWPFGMKASVSLGGSEIILIGLALIVWGFFLGRARAFQEFAVTGVAFSVLVIIFSDVQLRTHSFGQSQRFALEVILLGSLALLWLKISSKSLAPTLFVSTVAVGLIGFFYTSGGALLFSDDHPAFLYRLKQLKENFPFIPFYNPEWNGGVEAREALPSGALAPFLLALPIIALTEIESSYNWIVALLVFVLPAASLAGAAAILGLGRTGAWLAGTLALGTSLLWYRWALAYGTLGFITTAALAPLLLAVLSRLLSNSQKWSYGFSVALLLLSLVLPRWTPMLLVFIPASIFLVFNFKKVVRAKGVLAALLLAILINAPLLLLFLKSSNVSTFLGDQFSTMSMPIEASEDIALREVLDPGKARPLKSSLQKAGPFKVAHSALREFSLAAHPLILVGFLVGIFGTCSWLFRSTMIWLLLIGTIGAALIPRLELERLLLVLGLIIVLPLSDFLARFLKAVNLSEGKRPTQIVSGIVLLGLLLYTPLWLWRVTTLRTSEQFHFADGSVGDLTSAIKSYAGEGRVLFAGFILHELSHGHIAPLPAWTGKPIIASRYQHDRWIYTDVIPEEFRKQQESGVVEYMDLMNVSTVIAHESFWKNWLRKRPHLFKEIWKSSRFVMFERIGYSGNYILKGRASGFEQLKRGVSMTIEQTPVVIKFQYHPFLRVKGCTVEPYIAGKELALVEINNCLGPIVLEGKDPLSRLFD